MYWSWLLTWEHLLNMQNFKWLQGKLPVFSFDAGGGEKIPSEIVIVKLQNTENKEKNLIATRKNGELSFKGTVDRGLTLESNKRNQHSKEYKRWLSIQKYIPSIMFLKSKSEIEKEREIKSLSPTILKDVLQEKWKSSKMGDRS